MSKLRDDGWMRNPQSWWNRRARVQSTFLSKRADAHTLSFSFLRQSNNEKERCCIDVPLLFLSQYDWAKKKSFFIVVCVGSTFFWDLCSTEPSRKNKTKTSPVKKRMDMVTSVHSYPLDTIFTLLHFHPLPSPSWCSFAALMIVVAVHPFFLSSLFSQTSFMPVVYYAIRNPCLLHPSYVCLRACMYVCMYVCACALYVPPPSSHPLRICPTPVLFFAPHFLLSMLFIFHDPFVQVLLLLSRRRLLCLCPIPSPFLYVATFFFLCVSMPIVCMFMRECVCMDVCANERTTRWRGRLRSVMFWFFVVDVHLCLPLRKKGWKRRKKGKCERSGKIYMGGCEWWSLKFLLHQPVLRWFFLQTRQWRLRRWLLDFLTDRRVFYSRFWSVSESRRVNWWNIAHSIPLLRPPSKIYQRVTVPLWRTTSTPRSRQWLRSFLHVWVIHSRHDKEKKS